MKLSFVTDIKKSHNTCKEYKGVKRYVDTGNVKGSKIIGFEEYTYDKKPSRANVCVRAGDVLVAKMQNSIKVLLIDEENEDFVYSTGFYAFRDERILPAFLKYFFLSPYFNHEKDIKCTGGTQKAINDGGMKKISINVPSIEEQEAIIAKLDLITEAVECEEDRIELYDELVWSKYYEMFGDPIDNPMNWETINLSELGVFKNGLNYDASESGFEINCLGVGDFKDKFLIEDTSVLPTISLNTMPNENYLLQNEDIVFVRSNGNKELVGRCVAVYPDDNDITFSGFCIRFRKDYKDILTEYLLYTLKTPAIRLMMRGKGSEIQNINQGILSALVIPLTPIELQKDFDSLVKEIRLAKEESINKIDAFVELLNSLMHESFM
ncbi:MAG: restriction endonuclease subunit S [Clostridium perfringens]|nr:restriction endonuclease subunit S [Clostridium perfringens]MDU5544023.1 restriction endonuclease subunit S [Clostridium perfringens]